ncbi:Cell 5A endo-1 [Phytophthora nicotianae]|uniref:RING-type E3 ubiquitin transferase n=1 Tax=Phytophthora nicotianae TaxID=4792 RepID=A0A0W8DI42_PHYNI|nr:Cell 5A endo-1 [Phytophthora nicotianae]
MFLRSLYGSRMPQTLHPRVDPQASSYWEEDTASSQEIARAMEEADTSDVEPEDEGKKKNSVLAAALAGDEHASRRLSIPTLSSQLAALLGPDGMALDDMDNLRVEDMDSPVNAQLSPAGLISIAAADIDEANNNSQNMPPVNGELDLAFIRSLRQASTEADTETQPSLVVNAALRQLLGSLPTSRGSVCEEPAVDVDAVESDNKLFSLVRRHLNLLGTTSTSATDEAVDNAAEGQSKLRFLSLLRRINELRSQQVDVSYRNIFSLYLSSLIFLFDCCRLRAGMPSHTADHCASDVQVPNPRTRRGKPRGRGQRVNNTVCAVCCDEFEAEEEVRALPCLHFYHRECIDQWLMCHRQCPICKHVVAVY